MGSTKNYLVVGLTFVLIVTALALVYMLDDVQYYTVHMMGYSHHNNTQTAQDTDTYAKWVEKTGDLTEIGKKLQKVRILCWVTTTLANLNPKARYVKETWGKRCNILLFIGSQEDKNFPVIKVDAPEGRGGLAKKTQAALQYVYKHYKDQADWFLKADDDTYVVVDNLKYFLSDFDASLGLYFGFTFKRVTPQGYNSGGGGYVLSQEALRRFCVEGSKNKMCPITDGVEDVHVGKCMHRLGVKNVNTLDEKRRTRFHAYHPVTHMDASDPYLRTQSAYGYKTGVNNISNLPFTFHYVKGREMKVMEFLIYHIRHVSKEGTVLT